MKHTSNILKDSGAALDDKTKSTNQNSIAVSKKNPKHRWTQAEVELLRTHSSDESSWKEFQEKNFPGFTVGQLKNQFQQLVRREEKGERARPKRTAAPREEKKAKEKRESSSDGLLSFIQPE